MRLVGCSYRDFSSCGYWDSEDENCLNPYGEYATRAIESIVHAINDAGHISMENSLYSAYLSGTSGFYGKGTSLSRLSEKITPPRKALNVSRSALTRMMRSRSSFRRQSSSAGRFVSTAQEGAAAIAIKFTRSRRVRVFSLPHCYLSPARWPITLGLDRHFTVHSSPVYGYVQGGTYYPTSITYLQTFDNVRFASQPAESTYAVSG
ncbi:hypothetical protein ARMSODRAFT_669323 [Armillaria solidipes]|uniref:Uncharacterized protein n=1 Tax=Armillaria solidipes TaxID=1076256 RepID=A0A2H3ARC3_9AGAR|nr:hypothetical protein ARMSODRAFT_669323 [Armillaria solidipes]